MKNKKIGFLWYRKVDTCLLTTEDRFSVNGVGRKLSPKAIFLIFVVIVFIAIAFLRLPSSYIPFFNMDEGTAAVVANSILDGGIVYRDSIDTRGPVTHYVYALTFLLFGRNNMAAIHVVLIFLIFAITILLYFICTLIGTKKLGYWAAALFIVYSYSYPFWDMLAFHTEWLAILFSALGAYLFLRYSGGDRYIFLFASGVSFGLAFFSKQIALFDYFAVLLFCYPLTYSSRHDAGASGKALCSVIAGFLFVAILFVYYFYINGALSYFWFSFWTYNNYYVATVPLLERIKGAVWYLYSPGSFFSENFLLLMLFGIGALGTLLKIFSKSKTGTKSLLIEAYLISWCVFSYIGAAYSARRFGHYFIVTLPPFCIVSAKAIYSLVDPAAAGDYFQKTIKILNKNAARLFLALIMIWILIFQLYPYSGRILLWRGYLRNDRTAGALPVCVYTLTEYIKKNTEKSDKICVWGFFSEIYILSGRMPATRYIDCNMQTGLMPWANAAPEIDTSNKILPGSWKIFMDDMKKTRPKYIVDTSFGNVRAYGKYPPAKFKELSDFLGEHYAVEKEFFTEDNFPFVRLFRRK
jgi:4-amino-4-deoxy-L-arabinose transferase-like glycosyltransferase